MLVKSTPVRGVDGNVAMAVNIIEDVTDARRRSTTSAFWPARASCCPPRSTSTPRSRARPGRWSREVADWCWVDLPDDRGRVAAPRARRRARARDRDRRAAAGHRRGRRGARGRPSPLAALVDDDVLRAWTDRGAARHAARRRPRSCCRAAGRGSRVLGAMAMGTDGRGPGAGDLELDLAREMGGRAGIAWRTHACTRRARTSPRPCSAPCCRRACPCPGADGLGALPRRRRVDRGRRRLLRPLPGPRRLDGRHGRRDRQGPGRRGDHVAGALHDAHRRHLRGTPAACSRASTTTLAADPDRRRLCTRVCARIRARARTRPRSYGRLRRPSAAVALRDGRAARWRCPARCSARSGSAGRGRAWRSRAGDVLVLYTDGVTDTRTGRALRRRAPRGRARARSGRPIPTRSPRASTTRCRLRRAQRDDVARSCSWRRPSASGRQQRPELAAGSQPGA